MDHCLGEKWLGSIEFYQGFDSKLSFLFKSCRVTTLVFDKVCFRVLKFESGGKNEPNKWAEKMKQSFFSSVKLLFYLSTCYAMHCHADMWYASRELVSCAPQLLR